MPVATAAPLNTALANGNRPLRPINFIDRCIGTVVHFAMEALAQLPELPAHAPEAHYKVWRAALQEAGLHGQALDEALQRVLASVGNCLQPGGKGRWLLSPEHQDARNEWPITCVEEGVPCNIVVDRTFVERDSGIRWVVDYKNSEPESGENIEEFAARESAQYLDQLRRYWRALSQLGDEPVRAALYFTALGLWHPVDVQH